MENKINKTWIILMFIGVLLVIGVTVSFSYYGISVKTSLYDSGPNFKVGIGSNTEGLTVNEIKKINLKNKKPGYKDIIGLSVTANDSDTTYTYDLKINGTNSIVTGITYNIYKTNEIKNVSANCNETNDDINNRYYDTCTITNIAQLGDSVSTGTITSSDREKTLLENETIKNTTTYYYIVIEYPDTNTSQNSDFNTNFDYNIYVNIHNKPNCKYAENEIVFQNGVPQEHTFTPECSGNYLVEVWGAQGGSTRGWGNQNTGGYGGYSVGIANLANDNVIFINVGGEGTSVEITEKLTFSNSNGYNGGGYGGYQQSHSSSAGGGGATHIATISGQLKNLEQYKGSLVDNSYYVSSKILIVAGGGGGSQTYSASAYPNYSGDGGAGGGYVGSPGKASGSSYGIGLGGTQTTNGGVQGSVDSGSSSPSNPSFGLGASYTSNITNHYIANNGGGGGLYGGGAGSYAGGGGGSSYIASSLLVQNTNENIINKMYCYNCEESDNLKTYTVSTYGNTTHSAERDTTLCIDGYNINPISKCAKAGNGYARITYLGNN